jgi:ribosomal protein S5
VALHCDQIVRAADQRRQHFPRFSRSGALHIIGDLNGTLAPGISARKAVPMNIPYGIADADIEIQSVF